MTFSIVGRCRETGQLGIAISSSPPDSEAAQLLAVIGELGDFGTVAFGTEVRTVHAGGNSRRRVRAGHHGARSQARRVRECRTA